jgi:hypothetical protein
VEYACSSSTIAHVCLPDLSLLSNVVLCSREPKLFGGVAQDSKGGGLGGLRYTKSEPSSQFRVLSELKKAVKRVANNYADAK